MIVFAKGANYAIEDLSKSKYDVVGLDWTISPSVARQLSGKSIYLCRDVHLSVIIHFYPSLF